jgi:hypothetical protein
MTKVGDTLEQAIWLDGTETLEHINRWRDDCPAMLAGSARDKRVTLGPVRYQIKRPGDDRVPPVPAHISGPDVRLLVAEADVVAVAPKLVPRSFLADLDRPDLLRLREVTRRVRASQNPAAPRLTDAECDRVIEDRGPAVAERVVRQAVEGRVLH